ncbi:four-helix bundle copper-binding protein [Massilia sp. TS11]|uniref:four-helix bundle copper-binding protein n=1 Tax=Massilia sp. TS11 TaxID=2908003 RepID=UPI001EDA9606|nr:four-helix bundle copper-binding protein [Massilia sp. TS11]MCG2585309.1 four-helix bundle copper-binding protein [Massilia sp. TS11]
MSKNPVQAALAALAACAEACDRCAASCLREDDPAPMARCIAIDMDCAALCHLLAGMVARDSEFLGSAAVLCAMLCRVCAAECQQFEMDHCQACAKACEKCAAACDALKPGSP